MPAPIPASPLRSRFVLPLALCAGVIALAGCPKMPRISAADPSPNPTPSLSPKPSPSPSLSPSPSPTPIEDPTLHPLQVGSGPLDVVIDASGAGYAVLANDLVRVVGATGNLMSASTASVKAFEPSIGAPQAIVLSGQLAWFTDSQRKQLRKINAPSGGGTVGTFQDFDFGQAPGPLAMDNQGNLWLGDVTGRQVAALKANAGPSDAFFTGALSGAPRDLVADPLGTVWVAGEDGHLTKVSPALSGSTLTGLSVLDIPITSLSQTKGLALSGSGELWLTGVTGSGQGKLFRIDRATGTPTKEYNLSFVPGRFAIRGEYAWIPEAKVNDQDAGTPSTLYKVSLADGEVKRTFPLGGLASNVYKDENTDIWVSIGSSNLIVKLDF